MKGRYDSDDDLRIQAGSTPVGGTYTDARGVAWTVTVQQPQGGTGRLTWLAKSDADSDNGKWFYDQDRDRLFKSVDAYVDSAHGDMLGFVALLVVAALLLDGKRR